MDIELKKSDRNLLPRAGVDSCRVKHTVNSLIGIILAFSVSGPISVLAEIQPQTPSAQNQPVIIPQSSAIIISFPTALTLDANQKQSLTTAAFLSKPLMDSNGNVVVEANSPVNVQLQPTKGGVQITAAALVINGLVTPIQANGPFLPSHITTSTSNTRAQARQGLYGSVAGSVFNTLFGAFGGGDWLSGDQASRLTPLGNSLGQGLVTMTGLGAPRKSRQVDIPQGSVYILTLQASLTIPAKGTFPTRTPAHSASVATTKNPPAQENVAFNALVTPPKSVPLPASATIVYVNSATGVDSADAGKTAAAPYRAITYALSQAQAGTVIQLAPGSYTDKTGEIFPLVIKPGVTLRGDAANKGQNTVIKGSGRYISPTFARQNVTVQAENNSTIAGITITNPNSRGTALWVESSNPVIKNNTFTNSNREGIFVTGTAAPKIKANVFIKNGGNGISLARSAQGEIRNNLFQDTGFGMAIGGNSSPLVAENHFIQNRDGMFISEDAQPMLRNNVIKNNKRDGIVIAACSQAQPDLGTTENSGGNIFSDNGQYDIHNGGAKSLVSAGNQLDPSRVAETKQQQCS